MANRNQPERWEATSLAAAMAVAGAPFLVDKLAAFARTSTLSFATFLHSAPVLLVVAGTILLLADQSATMADPGNKPQKEDHHEL